ncbi:MAG: hypothetical protein O3A19_02520 [Planctomycetota bacterium]|jgi:hypothetical protein|nr:hypothetical protein [Planctomycetota bacterium]MDA1025281.1 hypothetical protein [Planctomycetota bacterium]
MQEVLDKAEQRAVELVRCDLELLGPLDEKELKEQVKAVTSTARGTLIFALAGAQSTRNTWALQGRPALGEAYSQRILRSVACFLGSEDPSELVGLGRAMGESEALLTLVVGETD